LRRLRRIATLTGFIVVSSAHVGSPDAWYEGNAGPYHVVVQVVTPGVVPGIATVYARVSGPGNSPVEIAEVTVQANRYDALAASPPPEIATPVEGDRGMYSTQLWVMAGGSNSVTVNVRGSLGTGKAVIPVVVVANRRLELDPRLGGVLSVFGVFLFIGLVTIVGAAVRESSLAPGETPDARRRWKARTAMAATAAVLALALFGGLRWWNSEDRNFTRSIYRPLSGTARVFSTKGQPSLEFRISDSVWVHRGDTAWLRSRNVSRWSPLIVDHGKLIHLFMIRDPDLKVFAHLHPLTSDSVGFTAALPPLPAGRYRVYGDIVHESGFNQTISTTLDLPDSVRDARAPTDRDDAFLVSAPNSTSRRSELEDGSVMTLEAGGRFVQGREAPLRFAINGSDAKPLKLEPYIGMAGHAVVTRDDGAVFVHLHPSGTISMASQMAITMRQPSDSVTGRLGQRINASDAMQSVAPLPPDGVVSFPYAFPKPGRYHIWVQVKHAGRILTGVFAVDVAPSTS
jgi:hypothetical protein